MQERIGPSYEPIQPGDAKKEAEKTNPVLFAQIQDFLYVNARADLLLKALHFLEKLQAEQEELPDQRLAAKAQEKLGNAKKLLPILQEFEQALKAGNYKQASALLPQISAKMNDPKAPLPPQVQKSLHDAFSQPLNGRNQTLNTLSFQSYLGQIVVAAQGRWGSNEAMVLSSVMDKLKELASAQPPTPFSEMAKNMLSDLQEGGLSKMEMPAFDSLQGDATKEGANLASKTLQTSLTQKEAYLQEVELESTLTSAMQGIEKAIKHQKEYAKEALKILREGAPQNKELQELEERLPSLKFPPKNDSEAESLHSFLNSLFSTYSNLVQKKEIPRNAQRAFLDKTKEFCDKAIKANEEGSEEVFDQMTQMSKQESSDVVKSRMKGAENAGKMIEAHTNALYTARADVENKRLMTPSTQDEDIPLPYQFAKVIFGKVIPNQNQALLAAGELLSFFNNFASGCNNIMSDLSGWSSASYDLNTYLTSKETNTNPPSNSFNIPASQAAAQASASQGQAESDYQSLYQAVQDIQQQIAQLKPPLNSQQQTRLTQLQGYQSSLIDGMSPASLPPPGPGVVPPNAGPNTYCACNNLSTAYNDYGALANYFNSLPPTQNPTTPPDPTKDKAAYDALNNLSNDESAVVNGSPNAPAGTPPTGLHGIYQSISSDQADYSGFSQQQQMKLQLTMTMTQQMFSTITSAMQDMNQAYSSIAQAVSK